MDSISPESVMSILSGFNLWWRLGDIHKDYSKPMKRNIYYKAIRILTNSGGSRIISISGPNRVGKTVLLHQMIHALIESGVSPQRILYIPFKHPSFYFSSLKEALTLFRENVYADSDIFCFLDDIQVMDNWEATLFSTSAEYPNARFVATSTFDLSTGEYDGGSEHRALTVLQLPTLSLYEYCQLVNAEDLPRIKGSLLPCDLIRMSRQDSDELFRSLLPVRAHFLRYLYTGGFPRLANPSDAILARQLLQEGVVGNALRLDIPVNYNVRNTNDLAKVFYSICIQSPEIISYDAIAKKLNCISRPTIEKYVQYLERANLIYISNPVDLANRHFLKTRPKVYIADPVIRNTTLMKNVMLADPDLMNSTVEMIVYKHIRTYYALNPNVKIGYFRSSGSKGKQVDIIVSTPKGKTFIDVKYRDTYRLKPDDAIWALSGEAQVCLVITKKSDDYGLLNARPDKLYRIPAHAFLYLLGNAEKDNYHQKGK